MGSIREKEFFLSAIWGWQRGDYYCLYGMIFSFRKPCRKSVSGITKVLPLPTK
ncbi:hypothetical protein [Bacteroides caecimuris]|uniref:hypothetical protein n=1 Tax=Bacteroides caecimuris TaxID=1796613 RepID=UPI00138F2DD6|nr:hypothetical protein [Bacteroides caecimuris]